MTPGQYHIWGEHLVDDLTAADVELRLIVSDVIDALTVDPYNDPPWNALSILPYKDSTCPNCYTVALGSRGLLLYQVMRDYRIVKLLDVILVP